MHESALKLVRKTSYHCSSIALSGEVGVLKMNSKRHLFSYQRENKTDEAV